MTQAPLAAPAFGQAGGAELKQKLAALKESAANQKKLRQYQWTEVQQITYKGSQAPATIRVPVRAGWPATDIPDG